MQVSAAKDVGKYARYGWLVYKDAHLTSIFRLFFTFTSNTLLLLIARRPHALAIERIHILQLDVIVILCCHGGVETPIHTS